MRIAFFGTPDFAVPSLGALVGESFDVVVAVTQPDRPRGRSRTTLVPPPVKRLCAEEAIPVLQPERPATPEFCDRLRAYEPDVGVVVAYGHILKPEVLDVPRHGMINVHASLLPKLRGAAPIQAAILSGMETTGVTIMQMEAGLDSGPILHQIATPVEQDETGGELTIRLSELGALALIEYLALWSEGAIQPRPQNDAQATFAPKITREGCRIDWQVDALGVGRAIRAFDPFPGAWSVFEGRAIKMFGPAPESRVGEPGEVLAQAPSLVIGTGLGAVAVREAQPEGRKRMAAEDWARGRGNLVGQRFE